MDTSSQTRGGRSGRPLGAPNYKNDILIEIVERYLPQGLEAWNAVAAQYQVESNELTLRRGEDLRENWNKKLCNRMQKPTGKPGVNTDRIFRCIEIERRIQAEAAAAILGADSAESGHSRDDGDSALSDVAQDDDLGNDGDEEDEEVAAVNAAEAEDDDENEAVVVRPRPQSLPAFVGVGVGASGVESPGSIIVQASVRATSSAGRRGGDCTTSTPAPPRRSPPSLSSSNISSGGGRGGGKTKNSTNRERGSIAKAMDRMAESIESGGGRDSGSSNMLISMLSMQMQQQSREYSMQQQMFQQQMQMQMAAMERRAETSEKYLRRIAKTIGQHNKRKRGGDDDEDYSTDNDE